jgi:hypothetical protein
MISNKFEKEIVFESSVLAWIWIRIRNWIRIELKCWIHIRIRIELIRIHNPVFTPLKRVLRNCAAARSCTIFPAGGAASKNNKTVEVRFI